MGGTFVAVGTSEGGVGSWTSPDGVTWQAGPKVHNHPNDDPGGAPGDDPVNRRTIGSGDPGVLVAQNFNDGLHVWFAPWLVLGISRTGTIRH